MLQAFVFPTACGRESAKEKFLFGSGFFGFFLYGGRKEIPQGPKAGAGRGFLRGKDTGTAELYEL